LNDLVEIVNGFEIVEGLPGEFYAWCDGFYVWDDGSLNIKATDQNHKCRGWFKDLKKLKNIIENRIKE